MTEPESLGIRTSRVAEAGPGGSVRGVSCSPTHGACTAPLFGPLASGHARGLAGRELVLVCVGVDGVPSIFLEEALWLCAEILGEA